MKYKCMIENGQLPFGGSLFGGLNIFHIFRGCYHLHNAAVLGLTLGGAGAAGRAAASIG